jgi:chlorite dismutase
MVIVQQGHVILGTYMVNALRQKRRARLMMTVLQVNALQEGRVQLMMTVLPAYAVMAPHVWAIVIMSTTVLMLPTPNKKMEMEMVPGMHVMTVPMMPQSKHRVRAGAVIRIQTVTVTV